MAEQEWSVPASVESVACVNPVRGVVEDDFTEAMKQRDTTVELIDTSIGDPTRFGTLPVHPACTEALLKVINSGKYNGYFNSSGIPETKEAVAKYFSRPGALLSADVSQWDAWEDLITKSETQHYHDNYVASLRAMIK